MSCYFIAQINIKNKTEYQKYLDNADDIFKKFNGKYLAVDNSPIVLEGKWNYSRTVLIKFDNKHDFEKWYYSDEYQHILKFRFNAAHCDSILISGKD